jgi:cell division protein FtsB
LDHAVKSGHAAKPAATNGDALLEKLPFDERVNQFFRRNWTPLLVAALALLLLQDIFGTHGLIAMRKSQKEAREVQQEITRLDQENQKLEENVRALKSDPAAIERIAREEMGLARPGEYIFKLPPKSSTPPDWKK